MARLPRMVLPEVPHHVTQRGNRRERTFFENGDYALYLDLLAQASERHRVEVWSYCLMPNHVHIVAVPGDSDALGRAFRDVHRVALANLAAFVDSKRAEGLAIDVRLLMLFGTQMLGEDEG